LNKAASSPLVGNDERKTELEEALVLLPLANLPGDDLPWLPLAHGAAAIDQGQAGGIGSRQKEEAAGPDRMNQLA
jgi:hypothetical protein